MIAQHLTRFRNGEQRLKFPNLATQWDAWEDFCQQFAAGTIHDCVSCRDDEGLSSADIRFKRKPTTLSDITGVNVPPQVPLS